MHDTKASDPSLKPFYSRKRDEAAAASKAAWAKSRQERRCAAIESAIQTKPRMTTKEDRKTVATNLAGILSQFEEATQRKKEEVLRAANMGAPGNSTKQLFNYTLPLDPAPSQTLEKRISKLVRRTDKYRRLAEKAAEIAGWDKRGALIELFRGSSYDVGEGYSGPVGDLPDYVFAVHDILDGMKEWLIKETRIKWYYEQLAKTPVCDAWGNFVFTWPTQDHVGGLIPYNEMAIPGIVLYRILAAELPIDFACQSLDELDGYDYDYDEPPPPGVPVEQGTFRRYFEVRLGLAPVGASGKIGLVFDQRRVDEIWSERGWCAYHSMGGAPGERLRTGMWSLGDARGGPQNPPIGVFEHGDGGDREPLEAWVRFRFKAFPKDFPLELSGDMSTSIAEENLIGQEQFVEEVNPRTCMKYLSKKVNGEKIDCKLGQLVWGASHSPASTIAASIERKLDLDVAAQQDIDPLDILMKREVEFRCTLLDTCLERRRRLLEEKKHSLFSRWGLAEQN